MRRAPKRPTFFYLNEWLAFRGMSQAELSRRTGLTDGFISQLVNERHVGSLESLEKIAQALDIPLGWLFDVKPEPGYTPIVSLVRDGNDYRVAIRFLEALGARPPR